MLKIKLPPQNDINRHEETLTQIFVDALPAWSALSTKQPIDTKNLLNFFGNNLQDILVGDVPKIKNIIKAFERDFKPLSEYLKNRPKINDHNYNPDMEKLIKGIEMLFPYGTFSKKHTVQWDAYSLVHSYKQRICPYCQLHHVNYHMRAGQNGFTMRPPLDHFFPKSIYPYLAVSLSNLIPCCSQCNSGVKIDRDPAFTIPHPHNILEPVVIQFKIDEHSVVSEKFDPETIQLTLTAENKSANYLNFFKLTDRYEWYRPEVCDMFNKHNNWMQQDKQVQEAILKDSFILGFERKDAENRTLGICLVSVAEHHKLLSA